MKIPIAALGSPAVAEEHSMPAPQTCGTNPIFDPPILLVDLFAGCGGLGEGFATFEFRSGQRPFQIIASVEKEPSACRTLRLRSFYRRLAQAGDPDALAGYYAYVRSEQKTPVAPDSDRARIAWQQAGEETLERTLGEPDTGLALKTVIHRAQKNADRPLVLIGGPPCQAYSSVGRVRNAGIDGYRPTLDHRHFLYRVYLELLSNHQPEAFVMENVKGILSSQIAGRRLFPRILRDLASPAEAYGQDKRRRHPHYRIYSLVHGNSFRHGEDSASIQPDRFIVQAKRYGIPQNRHRVILLGLREDLANRFDRQGGVFPCLCPLTDSNVTVRPVLADLPPLHSGLSWLRSAYPVGDRRETLLALFDRFAAMIEDMELRSAFEQAARQVTGSNLPQGGRSVAVRHSESGGNMETPCRNLTVRKVARLQTFPGSYFFEGNRTQ